MKIDDLVSLKKKTKLSESEILTEKDYVGGAPQKRYFTFARDPEPESDPKAGREKSSEFVPATTKWVPVVTPKKPKTTWTNYKKPVKVKPAQKQIPPPDDQKKITKSQRKWISGPKDHHPDKFTKLPPPPPKRYISGPKDHHPDKFTKLPGATDDPGAKKEITNTEKKKIDQAGKTSTEDAKKKALARARNNVELDKKRINTLTGKLEKLLDKPNLKQLQAIRDQIPLVRNKARRAILKKELLRIQNLHYSTTQHYQKKPIPVGPRPHDVTPVEPETPKVEPVEPETPKVKPVEPETPKVKPVEPETPKVKPVEPLSKDGQVLPKKGESIKAFAKRLGYPDVESFKKANPGLVGKITDPKSKYFGNEFVKTDTNYIDAERAGAKAEADNARRILNRIDPNSPRAEKLQARIDSYEQRYEGKPKPKPILKPVDLTIDPKMRITLKKTTARTIGNILRGGAGALTSVKGDILTTAVIAAATTYGYGKWGRNIALEQDRLELEDRKLRKEFEDNPANEGKAYESNALYKLSPMQYVGGAGNWTMMKNPKDQAWWSLGSAGGVAKYTGVAGLAEMLSHDESITRTMYESTYENEKDILDSYANMKSKNVADFPPTTDIEKFNKWLGDNVVTLMLPDGTMKRINVWGAGDPGEDGTPPWFGEADRTGAEAFKALLQPGTVIQVIPTHRYSGEPGQQVREEIDLKDQTKNMTTSWIDTDTNAWSGEFQDIYHRVSDKVERGGRITVGGVGPKGYGGKQMYIPTKMELDSFLLTHMEHLIPPDWYLGFRDETPYDRLPDEQKDILAKSGYHKRPDTPEGWLKKQGYERDTARRFDSFRYSGPDMTDQEKITWWKEYRAELRDPKDDSLIRKGIDPATPPEWTDANEGIFGRWWDKILDPVGQMTGLWKTGEYNDELTHDRKGSDGKVTPEEWKTILLKNNPNASESEINAQVKERMNGRDNSILSDELETKITTYVNDWEGKPGAPDTADEYNRLIDKLAIEHDLDPALLRTLGMTESTIQIQKNGKLNKWKPRGDPTRGTGQAFGVFHVRSEPKTGKNGKPNPISGASVEQFNLSNKTEYTWESIASNPMLAATIGAWYFKFLLKHNGGDKKKAYIDYTGGQDAWKLTTKSFKTLTLKQKKLANQLRANGKKFISNFAKITGANVARVKPPLRKRKDNDINP